MEIDTVSYIVRKRIISKFQKSRTVYFSIRIISEFFWITIAKQINNNLIWGYQAKNKLIELGKFYFILKF